ncbi:MAG: glycosyltransferase family 9 protein, partial [bacterium]|nr:glycosyltransferase family 9 protein [bacterium]
VNTEGLSPDRYILLRGAPRAAYRLGHYACRAGVATPETRPCITYGDWSTPALDRVESQGKPLVAVSSGATWATKRWNVERWAALCTGLRDVGYAVVQLGQGDERIGVGACLVDETTVREAACVLRAAKLFIGCDSGLMHLALAVGTQTLALFGPTDPSILVRNEPKLSVLTNERACRGCWNDAGREVREGVCPLEIPE